MVPTDRVGGIISPRRAMHLLASLRLSCESVPSVPIYLVYSRRVYSRTCFCHLYASRREWIPCFAARNNWLVWLAFSGGKRWRGHIGHSGCCCISPCYYW